MVEKIGKEIVKGSEIPGATNIRGIANLCGNADCYEELRLYIEYKIGKDNGWRTKLADNRIFGNAVLADMDKIYEDTGKDDKKTISRVGMYFGYLYWKEASMGLNK